MWSFAGALTGAIALVSFVEFGSTQRRRWNTPYYDANSLSSYGEDFNDEYGPQLDDFSNQDYGNNNCGNGGRFAGKYCKIMEDCYGIAVPPNNRIVCRYEACCFVRYNFRRQNRYGNNRFNNLYDRNYWLNGRNRNRFYDENNDDPVQGLGQGDVDRRSPGRSPPFALCYNGQESTGKCVRKADCQPREECVNGLCCTRTGDELKNACGGYMAFTTCGIDEINRRKCRNGMFCKPTGHCCECLFGQAAGSCKKKCPPGYFCETSGYCCPKCSSAAEPYGSCYNLQCGAGHQCATGNICCNY